MRSKIVLLSALLVSTLCCFSQRSKESINESWRFIREDVSGAEQSIFNDSSWTKVNIPHTWNATDAYTLKQYYRGVGWYRKDVYLTNKYATKQLFLNFEGAFVKAAIYVNGKLAGEHKGGFTAFTCDISTMVTIPGKNVIAVKVDNSGHLQLPPISGDYTMFGGLYRDAYLVSTERLHFDQMNYGSNGIFIETPQVNEKSATVKIKGTIRNESAENKNVCVLSKIIDESGKTIAAVTTTLHVRAGANGNFQQVSGTIASPRLWSPESPYLYTVTTTLLSDDKKPVEYDEINNSLGFRWCSFHPDSGFRLNGKSLKLIGASRHQDYMGLGNALDNDLHRHDMEMLKKMGGNFVRISHYPQDPTIVEMCDKLGILVWEETPLGNTFYENAELKATCVSSLKEMIRQNFNHPSIIIWGYMNEIALGTVKMADKINQQEVIESTAQFARELDSIVHSEDHNRVSTMALNSGGRDLYQKSGISAIPNVIGWNNYAGWYTGSFDKFGSFMDKEHAEYPKIISLISEFGAGGDGRLHSLKPEQFDFSIEWQQLYHESYVDQIFSRPYIAGAAVWNLIDFGSGGRQESMPRINNKGLLYNNRIPKDVYSLYQAWLLKTPVIHIASRDWTIRTGIQASAGDTTVTQPIKIYSNLDNVELFANGTSLGTQKIVKGVSVWNAPFVDGKNLFIAKGLRDGAVYEDALRIDFEILPALLNRAKGKSFTLGVNVGSNCFFIDPINSTTWLPDQAYTRGSFGYVGGEVFRSTEKRIGHQSEVAQTRNVPLYQTFRYGLTDYKFDVADGEYEVELHFSDPGTTATKTIYDVSTSEEKGQEASEFNVSINGVPCLENFCPAAQYGVLSAIPKTFVVQSKDLRGITVSFEREAGYTFLNAIKIRRLN